MTFSIKISIEKIIQQIHHLWVVVTSDKVKLSCSWMPWILHILYVSSAASQYSIWIFAQKSCWMVLNGHLARVLCAKISPRLHEIEKVGPSAWRGSQLDGQNTWSGQPLFRFLPRDSLETRHCSSWAAISPFGITILCNFYGAKWKMCIVSGKVLEF